MWIEAQIADVAEADTQEALERRLQNFIEDLGFASYCFVDGGTLYDATPFHIGTDPRWDAEYAQSKFVSADAALAKARRVNTPFTWRSVELPEQRGRRKPGAIKTMEAAADHGFSEGFVVPFHFVDEIGRPRSLLCSLFWRDPVKDFERSVNEHAWQIHLYLLYWMQRSVELRVVRPPPLEIDQAPSTIHLTDRERDVLSWASRGKTVADTAEILGISSDTVETHMRHAIARLGAGNKTHAVAKAIALSAIDI